MASAIDKTREGIITPVKLKANVTPLVGSGRKLIPITANAKEKETTKDISESSNYAPSTAPFRSRTKGKHNESKGSVYDNIRSPFGDSGKQGFLMEDRQNTGSTTPTIAFSPVDSGALTPSRGGAPRARSKVHNRYTSKRSTIPHVHNNFLSNDLTN